MMELLPCRVCHEDCAYVETEGDWCVYVTCGNCGSQTSTLVIRGMALGEINTRKKRSCFGTWARSSLNAAANKENGNITADSISGRRSIGQHSG